MHPEMLPSLVAERHRDIAASMRACRVPARTVPAGTVPASTVPARAARRRALFPRVTWSRVTLAPRPADAAGRGAGRSWVIVISATRPL